MSAKHVPRLIIPKLNKEIYKWIKFSTDQCGKWYYQSLNKKILIILNISDEMESAVCFNFGAPVLGSQHK